MSTGAQAQAAASPSPATGQTSGDDNTNYGDELSPLEQAALEAYSSGKPYTPPAAQAAVKPAGASAEPPAGSGEEDDEEVTLANGQLVSKSGKPVSKVVNHGALHAERSKHKDTKTKLTETESKLNLLMDLLNKGLGTAAAPAQAKTEPETPKSALEEDDIDENADPLGAIAQQKRRNKELMARLNKGDQTATAQAQTTQLIDGYKSAAQALEAKDGSFKPARNFWREGRTAELQALGVTDELQLEKSLDIEELGLIKGAVALNENPAERMVKLAKARGWKPAAAPAASTPAAVTPQAEALKAVAAAQQVNTSLGDLGGTAGGAGLTQEAVANMSQAQFDALVDKLEKEDPAKLRKLLGG